MNRMALRAALPLCPFEFPPPFDPAYFDRLRPGLYDFQFELLERVVAAIGFGYTRILIVLPTGGGKTHLSKALLGSAEAAQFIVHRKELIEQTSKAFWASRIRHGFVASDKPMDPGAAVLLCGIATLARRLDRVTPPEIVVWDEAQHLGALTWSDVMAAYPDDTIHIGLTATPERLDGRGLGEHFQVMICGPTTAELIEMGFLSEFDYYAPSRPDLSGVATMAGDFNLGDLSEVMDQADLVGDVVEHYLRLAAGKQGIVFAVSREHSRHIAAAFQAAGVRAAHIGGDTKNREAVDQAFRRGEIDILTNCQLLGEGYDVPGIVYCGLARPTKSLVLHLQQVGRALRVIEGKDRAVICDHAGNAFTHGLPDDPREWSLEGRTRRSRGAVNSDAEPVRQCLSCYRVSPSTVKVCPGCNTAFAPTEREIRVREGELQKLERIEAQKKAAALRKAEERACKDYKDFHDLAVRRGYANAAGWARMRVSMRRNYAARFGR